MKDYLARINDTAAMLLKQYHELMPHITFRRGLDECLAAEDAKLSELREMYGSKLGQMRYLSARYIDDHSEFARCQDVHPKYFTLKFQELFFISHRWAGTSPPDPQNTARFAVLQQYNRVNLVVPVDAPHMWHAAMESKACKLTVLSEHYRRLVEQKLI